MGMQVGDDMEIGILHAIKGCGLRIMHGQIRIHEIWRGHRA